MTTIRRVVTAQSAEGKNVFAKVEEIQPWQVGFRWYPVWGWHKTPEVPAPPATGEYAPVDLFPPTGGVNVMMIEFPPGSGVDPSIRPDRADLERYNQLKAASGKYGHSDPATGMHHTESVDIAFVVSGEIGLEQDDGVEVRLRPGDALLQMGALHAWRNHGTEPCLMAFVIVGADRAAVSSAPLGSHSCPPPGSVR